MIFEFALVLLCLELVVVMIMYRPPVRWLWSMFIFVAATGILLVGGLGNVFFLDLYLPVAGILFWIAPRGVRFILAGAVAVTLGDYLFIRQFHRSAVYIDEPGTYFSGLLGDTREASDLKMVLLVLLMCVGVCVLQGRAVRYSYEQLLLTTLAVAAGLFSFNVDNMVLLYLNLEIQALALYTLVGYYRFDDESTDAALRYLLAGSVVSGFTLLGFVTAYGEAGTFNVAEYHPTAHAVGGVWVLGALLFKLGAAPFHFWTPSVYTPLDWATLLLVVGPGKINIWFLLVKVLVPLVEVSHHRELVVAAAWLSIGVGAVGGLFQVTASALLAYSGILNGGYLLLLSTVEGGSFSFRYYLVVYLLGTAALIVVLSLFCDPRLSTYSYWGQLGLLSPLLLYYLVLNVAGLPVFPGFFGKLYLLKSVMTAGGWLPGVLLVLFSIVPAVYYVSLSVQALFAVPVKFDQENRPSQWTPVTAFGLTVVVTALIEFIVAVILG